MFECFFQFEKEIYWACLGYLLRRILEMIIVCKLFTCHNVSKKKIWTMLGWIKVFQILYIYEYNALLIQSLPDAMHFYHITSNFTSLKLFTIDSKCRICFNMQWFKVISSKFIIFGMAQRREQNLQTFRWTSDSIGCISFRL